MSQRKYINPSVKVYDWTNPTSGHELWLASRKNIISHNEEGKMVVGTEVIEDQRNYFDRIMRQGLQYQNFPTFVLELNGSVLFRDILFNINKIAQWAVSLRFVNSVTEDFSEGFYPISSEYKDVEIYEKAFDRYMESIANDKTTDVNRQTMPYSVSSTYWISMNLKTAIGFLSMLKIKMPFLFETYGTKMIEAINGIFNCEGNELLEEEPSTYNFDLTNYLVPYIDDSIAQYFDNNHDTFEDKYIEVEDMVILKKEMGPLLFSQFLRQSDVIIKGFYNLVEHKTKEEFLSNLITAETPIKVTYIAPKNKFLRTVSNRTCWFSQSSKYDINSWSIVLDIVLKNVNSLKDFTDLLPCQFKDNGDGTFKLCQCKYKEDVIFRNQGLEKRNLPCSILSNNLETALDRDNFDKTKLSSLYVSLTSKLVDHNIDEV